MTNCQGQTERGEMLRVPGSLNNDRVCSLAISVEVNVETDCRGTGESWEGYTITWRPLLLNPL